MVITCVTFHIFSLELINIFNALIILGLSNIQLFSLLMYCLYNLCTCICTICVHVFVQCVYMLIQVFALCPLDLSSKFISPINMANTRHKCYTQDNIRFVCGSKVNDCYSVAMEQSDRIILWFYVHICLLIN